jgi:shikimate dehydrogenase
MRLALLGYPIQHSLSPRIYRELLGKELESYELLEIQQASSIPSLNELATKLEGLSITSPYKRHFFGQVTVTNPLVNKLGALNTLSFSRTGIYGTNTDMVAVESLLKKYRSEIKDLQLVILGSGSMAKLTILVADALGINYQQFARSQGDDVTKLDLSRQQMPLLVINACSRDFIFNGKLPASALFWDYNYSFLPHQTTLPSLVKSYIDGEEMLRLQAIEAVNFWRETQA